MILYHGTDEWSMKTILMCGYIDNAQLSETTELYNDTITAYAGENLRKNCIYLTPDKEAAEVSYDVNFRVNTDGLDERLLYVADFRLLEDMFAAGDRSIGRELALRYNNSIIPFSQYKEGVLGYTARNPWELEFLYFSQIPVSKKDATI